jgi:hypothetical protein
MLLVELDPNGLGRMEELSGPIELIVPMEPIEPEAPVEEPVAPVSDMPLLADNPVPNDEPENMENLGCVSGAAHGRHDDRR